MPQQAKKKNKTAQNNCPYTFSAVNACMYNCLLPAYEAQDGTGQDVTKMAGGNARKLNGPAVSDHA